jgi:hypothetical protein
VKHSKFTEETRSRLLGGLRDGLPPDRAASAANVTWTAVVRWLRRGYYEDSCGVPAHESAYVAFMLDFEEADAARLARLE